jgi:hypothetical protein
MNKLWVFGDSYSTINREKRDTPKEYRSLYTDVANHLQLEEENLALSGLGNFEIFNNLLKFLPNFKKGDLILFQLSILNRFSYINLINKREFNLSELRLFSMGNRFFCHPQFHTSNVNDVSDKVKSNIITYIENYQKNNLDFYYKFLIQLKYILIYLETIGVKFKLILLETEILHYNEGGATDEVLGIIDILKDLSIEDRLIKLEEDVYYINKCSFYKEKGIGYDYHHFSLDTIKTYSDSIIKHNF